MYAVEDTTGSEIMAYHWHPGGQSAVTSPHLHLPATYVGLGADGLSLSDAHIPTGGVALERLLLFLINELHAVPQRNDWQEVLSGNLGLFQEWRTWHGEVPPAAAE